MFSWKANCPFDRLKNSLNSNNFDWIIRKVTKCMSYHNSSHGSDKINGLVNTTKRLIDAIAHKHCLQCRAYNHTSKEWLGAESESDFLYKYPKSHWMEWKRRLTALAINNYTHYVLLYPAYCRRKDSFRRFSQT